MGLGQRSGWHDLRHHHASLLIAAGCSPRAVAERLGHADPSETLRTYSHLWPSDEARMLAAVEDAYPAPA
jgi:integrase